MKIGLKLWSTNIDHYWHEAKKLYSQGVFDYIELYVVPDTLHTVAEWKKLPIPFVLHAPHFMHGINLADKECFGYNQKIYGQVEVFRTELNAKYTVVHAGMDGTIEETVRQLQLIKPKNFLIENKPPIAPLRQEMKCRGAVAVELAAVISNTECGFCLDVGHAFCTANYYGFDCFEYLEQLNSYGPVMYHLSDGDIDSFIDKHLHLGEGSYDIRRILSVIGKNGIVSIETQKNSKENLDDFVRDIELLGAIHG